MFYCVSSGYPLWDAVFLERANTLTNSTKAMTPGQMRQIISLAISAVPADLSYEEASRILRPGKALREKVDSLWNMLRATETTYSVKLPKGDILDLIHAQDFGLTRNLRLTKKSVRAFEWNGDRKKRVTLETRMYTTTHPGEVRRMARAEGYRLADIREAFAFMLQNPHHSEALYLLPPACDPDNIGALLCICSSVDGEPTGFVGPDDENNLTHEWYVLVVKL